MTIDLFAGIPGQQLRGCADLVRAAARLPTTFFPNDIEAVWEVAEHRYLVIEQRPEHAGHAMHAIFVDDFDARLDQIADRGLEPASGRPTRTACARPPTVIPTGTRSGSAVLRLIATSP
jgi:hypothetical protein